MYSQLHPSNVSRWRHPKKGPKIHWESSLSKAFGDRWRDVALDRKAWRSSKRAYIHKTSDALLGQNSKPWGVAASVADLEIVSRGHEEGQGGGHGCCAMTDTADQFLGLTSGWL